MCQALISWAGLLVATDPSLSRIRRSRSSEKHGWLQARTEFARSSDRLPGQVSSLARLSGQASGNASRSSHSHRDRFELIFSAKLLIARAKSSSRIAVINIMIASSTAKDCFVLELTASS